MTDRLRIVYFGTPDVAVPPLEALVDAGFEIPLVVSGPDKRRGRGSTLHPSPVKAVALELGLTVSDRIDDCLEVDADLGVVVAYGHLIKPHVLAELPMVNLHFSLLPRWRGAAPVERALLEGDAQTGVCLMQLEETLDTGGVYRRITVPISDTATLASLRAELVDRGSELLVSALHDGLEGLGEPEPQVGEPVYAKKIQPGELRLDLNRPASVLDRTIRLGRAWCEFRGARFRIWEAPVSPVRSFDLGPGQLHLDTTGEARAVLVGTGDGVLRLVTVQPEGKPRMTAEAWWNGPQPEGERLG